MWQLKVVEYLIEAGAEVNQPGGNSGETPLMEATYREHPRV